MVPLLGTIKLYAQADGCSAATTLPVTTVCSPQAGTTLGATQTIPGCSGNADDDVWYKFTATSSSQQITVNASAGFDAVLQLFSGPCNTLVSLVCKDDNFSGQAEVINYSGFTVGATYTLRVYHYGSGSGSGNFDICVTQAPAPPANNNCSGAAPLTVNTACIPTAGTTVGATPSVPGCAGNADDDVWYSFVATNAVQTITVNPSAGIDPVLQLFSGTCASLTGLYCQDAGLTGGQEVISAVGLVPGQTYYIRVYDYYTGNAGTFNICVTGAVTSAPTNDEPCTAIALPAVTAACSYSEFTTVGSTASPVPAPSSCAGGSGAANGGWSASSRDVWFAVTVPPSGNLYIQSKPNMPAGRISDGVMALYSGSCSSLTQIACSDDNPAYPGSNNDNLPLLSATGLTPGSTVYLRYFGYGTSQGTFGFCVTTAINDNCANALYICDINGYSSSTSGAYTADRPCNMRGNNEDVNGVNQPDGINTGGIFGQGGPWGTGAPNFDVIINNNSWIKFTAAATTATLQVSIYDCWVGNYPSGGIQMQIFSGTNCCNFVPVSNFEESSSGFIITANGLSIGQDYYLMVDGFAGDICNYTITAQSGVQFPDIPDVPPVCEGSSVTLTAPAGATSYEWQHNGATTQSVTVTPGTTQTYYCEVTGLCGYKQTLDVVVAVTPKPIVSINNGNAVSTCQGTAVTLSATGAAAYVWNTSQTSTSISVNPASSTSYSVIGTSAGCSDTAQVMVTVNALPALSINPTETPSNCSQSTGALTGAVATGSGILQYAWYNNLGQQVGNTANLSNQPAGLYTLTVTDGNNCQRTFGPFSITNPGAPLAPTVTPDANTVCIGGNIQISASSASAGATFSWSGPAGFNASSAQVNLSNMQSAAQGNYCVVATVAGCTGPPSCVNITVHPLPDVQASVLNPGNGICTGTALDLSATGAQQYSWSGPLGFTAASAQVSVSPATTANTGMYIVTGTDANGCFASDTVQATVYPLPLVQVSSSPAGSTLCENGSIILNASGGIQYSWSGPQGFSSAQASVSVSDSNATAEGWYYVMVTDANGCSAYDSIYADVITDIPLQIQTNDVTLCPGTTLVLNATGGVSYLWTGPLGFSDSTASIQIGNISTAQSGTYAVIGFDANGCTGSDSALVTVTYSADCMKVPELVTPNGDNQNDGWIIHGLDSYPNASVQIFNRWGNLIFSASPYQNNWYGQVNKGLNVGNENGKVPAGTYFYLLDLGNNEPALKGFIEVQY